MRMAVLLRGDRRHCSARLRSESMHPLSIRIYPVAYALCAVEPQRAARIAIDAGILAQVAVLTATCAHSCQPTAFGCGELHRGSRIRPRCWAGPAFPRECVTAPGAGPLRRLGKGEAATASWVQGIWVKNISKEI